MYEQGTVFSWHQEEIKNNIEVTITACQSEEADQQLICQALHCLSSCFSYEKIVIHTIETNVMILLIIYLSNIFGKCLNVLVYAKMVTSGIYHNIKVMILALDTPHVQLFFYSKGKCK